MIDHSDEEIEEQRCPTRLHLQLHRAAALERVAAANDEGEIVRSHLRVACGCVGVGESSTREDGAALHAGLQALLLECETLELGEVVTVS